MRTHPLVRAKNNKSEGMRSGIHSCTQVLTVQLATSEYKQEVQITEYSNRCCTLL